MKSALFHSCFLYKLQQENLTGIWGIERNDSISKGHTGQEMAEAEATKDLTTSQKAGDKMQFSDLQSWKKIE